MQQVVLGALTKKRLERGGHRRGRRHQPARNHGALGPPHRGPDRQRHRLAGHPDGPVRQVALGDQDRFREKCGLPLATYFSGPKIRWLLDNTPGAREAAKRGDVLFGTMDTWLIWNATGRHVTDVTNASRTMLMNLATLDWDEELLEVMGVPRAMLAARSASSSEVYAHVQRAAAARRAGGRRAGRPAGGPVRPDLFCSRRGQVHLWHRRVPAAEYRRGAGAVQARPADDAGISHRRGAGGLRPGRRPSRWQGP